MKNKKFVLYAVILLSLGLGWTACKRSSNNTAASVEKKTLYHCPMHPTYISEKPGDCPICGMRLVPMEEKKTGASPEHKVLYYRNPMDPRVTSPVPTKDSMGMDYVPVYADDIQTSSGVSGQAPVQMSNERVQLIGVKTTAADVRPLSRSIRAAARVAYDPALYSAIVEHQEAVRASRKSRSDESNDIVRASKLRLRQMGLSDAQIEEVASPTYDASTLLQGQKGGRLWVYADLYEDEASLVKPGQSVELTAPTFPGRTFHGTVRAVDTVVNSETRTLRARIEVSNSTGELKPDMFFQAAIRADLGERLAVPASAVMDSGTRQLVFVQTQPGHFVPREVKVGRTADDWTEIVSGVQAGEIVVTSANFLIDSESKIKAAYGQ